MEFHDMLRSRIEGHGGEEQGTGGEADTGAIGARGKEEQRIGKKHVAYICIKLRPWKESKSDSRRATEEATST